MKNKQEDKKEEIKEISTPKIIALISFITILELFRLSWI
tara:strand:+ start:8183 stop:8299 length:117 start_codon:yes stop_codon:yes gene_type:complete